jgi:hypothetical protein
MCFSDTEMLDWLIKNMVSEQNDEEIAKLLGAILMGKDGREAISFVLSGGVPSGVAMAAIAAARSL